MTGIKELWMVVRTDFHGTSYLMQDELADKQAAHDWMTSFLERQTKGHKQDYEVYPYTPENKAERMAYLRIMLG